jgi:hypothetical protein
LKYVPLELRTAEICRQAVLSGIRNTTLGRSSILAYVPFGFKVFEEAEEKCFYVDANGSDKNSGGEKDPFATIDKALKGALKAAQSGGISHAVIVVSGTIILTKVNRAAAGDELDPYTKGKTAILIANEDLPCITLRGKSEAEPGILDAQGKQRILGIAESNTLTLGEHITLTGGKADAGGAIHNEGTFLMDGGTISGNEAKSGGGVFTYSGPFILRGGTISNNTSAPLGSDYGGGGVNGGLIMEGGTIANNTFAGVYAPDCNVVMKGGVIENNQNGGINVCGSFKMSGGIIRNNTAEQGGGLDLRNPGVGIGEAWDADECVVEGGEIYGNSAEQEGGGIYIREGTFCLRGGTIENNTSGGEGSNIYVGAGASFEGDLDEGVDYDANSGEEEDYDDYDDDEDNDDYEDEE